jgi:prepilin-type N-terminal cleavage/methylation domain-containing protein
LKGFTLLELLISLTIFSVIIAAATTIFINSQATKQRVDQMTQAQQSARTAIDYMIKDLRAAGYNIDIDESETSTPQRRIVYASPYEVIFNANILPAIDTPDNPQEPQAMQPNVSLEERPAHYNPSMKYLTGAETIIYSFDWNNDGLIDEADRNTSPASLTPNPDDYCLIKRVYGEWSTGSNSKPVEISDFDWKNQELVSIVGGPDRYPSQNEGTPMFLYWIDNDGDATTPPDLYGDDDGDGTISQAEANGLAPIADFGTLEKIEIITVNVTGVSSAPYKGVYHITNISTDVAVTRNVSTKVYLIKGHVYEDADVDGIYDTGEDGIADMRVKLSTGEMALTDEDGIWTFAIIPGSYGVSVSPEVLWRATTAVNFDFSVTNDMIDFTIEDDYKKFFGMEQTPSANVRGIVFHDLNGDGLWQKDDGETGISGIEVATSNNSVKSISSPSDSIGFYDLLVNAGETLAVWTNPPLGTDSLASSGVDTIDVLGIATAAITPIPLTSSMARVLLTEDEIAYLAFGFVNATGNRPSVRVISPNGAEIYTSGSNVDIKTYANSNDSGEVIKKIIYFYSIDAGYNWNYIGESNYPSPSYGVDTFLYNWTIPDSVEGSQLCLVRVDVIDEGNWTVMDMSDNYFTIVPSAGYTSLYFTNAYVDSLRDDSLYLYAFYSTIVSFSGPLPRYLNTVNSRTEGSVGDSLPNPGTEYYSHRRLYTQMSTYAEFVTEKGIPYADTIQDGDWVFTISGSTTDPDSNTLKWFDFEVYACDSFGRPGSRYLLFSTFNATTYSNIVREYLTNADASMTTTVTVPHKWNVNRSDRLYIKTYYTGTFANPTSLGQDKPRVKVTLNFGGEWMTKVRLPQ